MTTKIINLYGGPGTGKSTSAATLYAWLKQAGHNAELVREYAKDWAWDQRPIGTYDQLYIMGKQMRRESMLYGKVSHIVTDSPVALSHYYAMRYSPQVVYTGVRGAVEAFYEQARLDGHEHLHVFLERSKPYNPAGRYQTEEQARLIDAELLETMKQALYIGLPIITGTDEGSLTSFFKRIR